MKKSGVEGDILFMDVFMMNYQNMYASFVCCDLTKVNQHFNHTTSSMANLRKILKLGNTMSKKMMIFFYYCFLAQD